MEHILTIGLLSCCSKEYYKNQILSCEDTWCNRNDIPIYFFSGEECLQKNCSNKVVHLPGIGDDVKSATYKQWHGLRWMFDKHPNASFYYFAGTDTYARIDKLQNYLKNMNPKKFLYIGGDGHYRNNTGKLIYYHSGGSGFILSNSLMKEIYDLIPNWIDKWNKYPEWIAISCDWSLAALFMEKNIRIELLNLENFKSCNWKGLGKDRNKCCSPLPLNKLWVCHYMQPTDMIDFKEEIMKEEIGEIL